MKKIWRLSVHIFSGWGKEGSQHVFQLIGFWLIVWHHETNKVRKCRGALAHPSMCFTCCCLGWALPLTLGDDCAYVLCCRLGPFVDAGEFWSERSCNYQSWLTDAWASSPCASLTFLSRLPHLRHPHQQNSHYVELVLQKGRGLLWQTRIDFGLKCSIFNMV